jgi:MurNAc alpha-1-phosphate uridylyltransferase
MQCVILAGGLGTRLGALTKTVPKALVPIRGRPFVDYQLDWLARNSVEAVVFCIGYLGAQIVEHVGDGAAFGLAASYVEDGEALRGTGGALRRALDAGALAESFLVLYGDSFLPISFARVFKCFQRSGCAALMTVMRNEGKWDRSNVVFAPPRVALYDKRAGEASRARMTHIDYGLSVLARDLIAERVPANTVSDLADLFRRLSLTGKLAGYEVAERFYEIGSVDGIADFTRYVAERGL